MLSSVYTRYFTLLMDCEFRDKHSNMQASSSCSGPHGPGISSSNNNSIKHQVFLPAMHGAWNFPISLSYFVIKLWRKIPQITQEIPGSEYVTVAPSYPVVHSPDAQSGISRAILVCYTMTQKYENNMGKFLALQMQTAEKFSWSLSLLTVECIKQ